MKKMWKRFVSLLLACTLLAGMLPLSASAASEPTEDSQWITEKIKEINAGLEPDEQYHRGNYYKLGDSDLYRLTFTRTIDTETATITDAVIFIVPGTDADENNSSIPDYNSLGETPWEESSASAIYIADGVTGIGDHAFDGMTTLETIEFENSKSLTKVGEYAFNNCDKMVGLSLDLSNVTTLGKYAFNGCERLGSGENNKGVTLSDELTTIPENAFNTCGLKNVNIPTSCTEIGNNAFANNSLSQITELALPERLQKIGDNAFSLTMGEGNTSSGITSLTIPSSVESIGANAFSGRRNLQTVTVEDDKQDGTELILGDGAFGKNEFTAYSEQGSITDAAGTTYHGLLGTTFYLPADLVTTFRNGENCFTGDISPMEYVNTVPPTCTTNGYHIYKTTISGAISGEGQPVVVTYHVPLQMLGHDLDDGTPVPASCETGSSTLYKCQRENCSYTESQNIQDNATGHNYTIQSVSNLAMGNGTATVFTWECQQSGHSEERDRKPKEVSITVTPSAIQANTTMTYGDLANAMPTVTSGTLALASSVDEDKELTTEVQSVPVVFTPDSVTYAGYTGVDAVSEFEETSLTLQVNVSKATLDFSGVSFGNTRVFVNSEDTDGTPITVYRNSLPEDVKVETIVYSNETGDDKTTPPTRDETWSGTVSVTFTYDADKYDVDSQKTPGGDYTFNADTSGKVTITHPYVIVEQTMDNLAAEAISPLTYNTQEQNTVHLSNVPYSSTVSWKWVEVGNPSNRGEGTATSSGDENTMDTVPFIEAGTYIVTITVEKEGFTSRILEPITVTIAKATVTTPTATAGLEYTGTVQTGLETPSGDDLYTYTEDSQLTGTNAGNYTATAQLNNSENYQWSTGDDNGAGKVEISWNIAKRQVIETSIGSTFLSSSVPYTGSSYTAVSQPTSVSGLFDITYSENGTLVGTLETTGEEAFTITNARQTNAGTYEVIATITDFDNFYWQNHPENASYSLERWRISPQQINAPTITAPSATYDGEAYDGTVTLEHSKASDSRGSSRDIIDLENTKSNIRYYTQRTGGNGGDAPVNAGTYFAGVENWVFEKDKIPGNYTILGGQRGAFTISKAPLTLTTPIENLSVTYTGSDQTVPPPTVEGLQGDDTASDYSLVYTYTIGESEVTQNQTGELKLSQVGTYNISVSVSQECTNYTSNTVKYDFTISTANQTVKLTGEGLQGDGSTIPYTISKTLGDDPFTVTGKGYVGENETNAKIAYAVTQSNASDQSEEAVVKVDANSGRVTLLRAGSATITVTAEGSANYQAATATYTITVDKGTPTVAVQMPEGGSEDHTYSYTGEELRFAATVTGAPDAVEPVKKGKVSFKFYQDNSGSKGAEISGGQPTGIGTYWVEAVYEGDDNYNPEISAPVKFTISPAALEVEAKGYTDTYNGDEHDPASITVKGVGGAPFEKDDYTVSYAKKTDGQADAPDADSNEWKPDTQVKDVADSGDYWFKVVINEGDSYNAYIGSVTVDIDPKQLTVTKTVKPTKEYDGTADADVQFDTIATEIPGESVTADSVSAVYDSPNANVDNFITITYQLTAGPNTDLDNYSVSTDGGEITEEGLGKETVKEVNGISVGIDPAPITVAINDQTSVYDGKEPYVAQEQGTSDGDTKNWYVSEGTIYNLDDLDITLSIDSGSKDAGAYAITGKAENKNYKVTFTGNWQGEEGDPNNDHAGIYTITPRPIKVEIGDADGFYGDVPVLDNVALDDVTGDGVSDAGLVDGEVLKNVLTGLKLATTANAQSDISDEDTPYTIYAKNGEDLILDSTQLGNYEVTFTNKGTYTVKPRPITITIADHSSVYGEKIDGGIADPVSDKDYTVAITEGNTVTGGAIVNKDDLGIALSTTAQEGDNAGTYSISGKVSDGDVSKNYSITWAGETPWNGSGQDSTAADSAKGTYTIDKAQLKVSVNRSDIYAQYGEEISNPVTFTNESTGQKIASDASDYTALSQAITYGMEPQGGLTQVEGSQKAEGKFTVAVTQQMVTVTVNVAETENYEAATEITYHIHASASGSLDVSLPFADLTYNGQPQQLLAQAPELPDGVYIRYKVGESGEWTAYSDKNQDNWKEVVGENAGSYTVYWETTSSGNYNASSGNSNTSIAKATLEGSFAQKEYTHVLTKGNRYDSATANELTIRSAGYGAEPAKYTYRSADTTVAMAENGGSTIRIMGSAGQETTITVTVPGDDNYNEGTFTYKLKISDKLSKIEYDVTGTEATYNGQPQTIAVKVTAPASGATVRYWNEEAKAYDLSEPPAYTDVKAGGYTIKFQITAPGYETVDDGTATLKINPRDISQCQVEGIAASYTFVNKPIEPQTVEVVDGSVILTKNTDYTLEYGANQEVGEDTGTVIIKGTGNYTGEVIEHFDIIPVDGSSGITASIAPNFGTYDPDAPVTAEVTVTHQTGSGSHDVDLTAANAKYTISATDLVTGQTITDHGATGTGGTLTFTKPAIYDITLTLTGDHQGEFRLSYTLLPLSNEDGGLTLTVDDETQKVFTYGGEIDPSDATIKVTANNTDVTDQCTLTYEYTGFDQTIESGDYSSSVLKNAGVYTVTATPTDGSAITGTGTFTFLILQRDLSKATLTVEDGSLVYNQTAQEPSVTVAVTGNPTADDYTITYYNNVNASDEAKAVVTAKGNNFTGSQTADFTIAPKPITHCEVENIPEQYYTGNAVIPPVTITDGNYTLILGYDYTTACEDKGPGAATVTITGTGNYTGTTTKDFVIKSEGAPEPSERFDLVVTPSQWIWKDDLTNLRLSVTFGTGNELTLGKEYTLEVNGQTFDGTTGKTKDDALTYIKGLKPSEYTITATGVGAYNGSTDTETVTIQKIQPKVTVTATPNSLSGGGKVTLTLKGEKLPDGTDLKNFLKVTAKNDSDVTLEDLHIQWPEDGSLTAELTLPNTNETYTFTLTFTGNEYYEAATASEQVVVAQQIISGGGGGPVEDQPANPDDTGVSDWLNTKDHLAYLAGYPGGIFGPDQNMTRAEAAQMFYNLLLEKDVEITVEFEDVPADAWYAKPVNTLASLGILSGVGNGRFDPERSITRAEFTVIAMKFANTSGGGVNIFSDVNEDDWFYSAVVDSTQYGWINGYPDGTFRPEATISRAEVTVIVNHMLGRAADRPYVIAHEEELNTFGDVNRGHWGYFHIAEATNAHEYHTEDGTESWTGLS